LHPEVTHVGLVTAPYAGIALFSRCNYSRAPSAIVTKLKRSSLSAGNLSNLTLGSSETKRAEIVENVKGVSPHVPARRKPFTDEEFGHYLAGLIDGDGHISTQQQLVLCFHENDATLAYYLKTRLGCGCVSKVKNKKAVIFVLSRHSEVEKVMRLVNGKLRLDLRYRLAVERVLNHKAFIALREGVAFTKNSSTDLENH
jgi:hypothetical protein